MIRTGILTVSDRVSRGETEDVSGPTLHAGLPPDVFEVCRAMAVPDDVQEIVDALGLLCDRCELVITTGGTGLSPRDVTPEATAKVVDRLVPGIAEALRADGRATVPTAALSRGIAGMVGWTLIINLPGSPGAIKDGLRVLLPILPHAIETMRGEGPHGGTGEPREL